MKKVLTPASNLGITLTDAKEFLRVEFNDDDTLITQIIKSSTLLAQNIIGQQLTEATYIEAVPYFNYEMELFSPVKSITSVKYYDENNTLQTLSSSAYRVLDFGLPHKIVFDSSYEFPSVYSRPDAVQITFVCGMTSIPSDVETFIKIKIGTAYEYRTEFESSYSQLSKLDERYIQQFLAPYRVYK